MSKLYVFSLCGIVLSNIKLYSSNETLIKSFNHVKDLGSKWNNDCMALCGRTFYYSSSGRFLLR